ncbi:hypothetical protein HXX76_002319 [Chlamydomonas incerta]|uniref:CRM domain-containing protein n=1 Tax=Chlamydomonas incerta TaxID=51695 RepID=A0A835SIM8_CHLIN|nr:hypothetical protein HXX76_002319 [Chlamydomonas incerta]|eukprot:KAG2423094.1 hypothetical protein HXX76_002319 [Chlamydomonas incerta]
MSAPANRLCAWATSCSRGAIAARASEQLLDAVNGVSSIGSSSALDPSPGQASALASASLTAGGRGHASGLLGNLRVSPGEPSTTPASSSGRSGHVAWIASPWPLVPLSSAAAPAQRGAAAAVVGLPHTLACTWPRHFSSPSTAAAAAGATGARSSSRRKGGSDGSRDDVASSAPDRLPAAVDFKDLAAALGRAGGAGGGGSKSLADAGADPDAFNFVQVGRPLRMRLSQPEQQQAPASQGTGLGQQHQSAEGGGGSRQERRRQRWQQQEGLAALQPGLGSAGAEPAFHGSSTSSSSADDEEGAANAVDTVGASAEAGELERIPLLHPTQRQQTPLHPRAAAELWRAAEALAGSGRLVRVAVGRQGLTRGVLAQAGELLEVHELVRMYLLPTCGLEVGFVGWVAEAALDCVTLRTKGRTVTLYRERGLPRPPASFKQSPEGEPLPTGLGSSGGPDSGGSSSRGGSSGSGAEAETVAAGPAAAGAGGGLSRRVRAADASGASWMGAGLLSSSRAPASAHGVGNRSSPLWSEPQELLRGGRWPRGDPRARSRSASGRPCGQPVWEEDEEQHQEAAAGDEADVAAEKGLIGCAVDGATLSTTSVSMSQSPRMAAAPSLLSYLMRAPGQQQQESVAAAAQRPLPPAARPPCPRSQSLTGPSAARRLLSLFGAGGIGGGVGAAGGSGGAGGSFGRRTGGAAAAAAAAVAKLRPRRCGSEGTNDAGSHRASVETVVDPGLDGVADMSGLAAIKAAVKPTPTPAPAPAPGLVSGTSPLLLPSSPPPQRWGREQQQAPGRPLPPGADAMAGLDELFEGLESLQPQPRCCSGGAGGGGAGRCGGRLARRHANMVVLTGTFEGQDVIVKVSSDAAPGPAGAAAAAAAAPADGGAADGAMLAATATAARLAAAGHPHLAPVLALRVTIVDFTTGAALAAEAAAEAAEAAAVTPVSLPARAAPPAVHRASMVGPATPQLQIEPRVVPAEGAPGEAADSDEEPDPLAPTGGRSQQLSTQLQPLEARAPSSISGGGGGGGFGSSFVVDAVQPYRPFGSQQRHHVRNQPPHGEATAATVGTAAATNRHPDHLQPHPFVNANGPWGRAGRPLRQSLELPSRLGVGGGLTHGCAGTVVSAAAAAAALRRQSVSARALAPQPSLFGRASAANARDSSAALAAAVTGVPGIEVAAPPPPPSRGRGAHPCSLWSPAAGRPAVVATRGLHSAPAVAGTHPSSAQAEAARRLYPLLAGLRLRPGARLTVVVTERSELGSLAAVACSPSTPFAPRAGWSAYRAQRALLATALEVAAALAALHAAGAAHGSLQPSNVLLFLTATAKGAATAIDPRGFTAKLADVGTASSSAHVLQPAPPAAHMLFQAPEVLSPPPPPPQPPPLQAPPLQPPPPPLSALPTPTPISSGVQYRRGATGAAAPAATAGGAGDGGTDGGVGSGRPAAPAAAAGSYSLDSPAGVLLGTFARQQQQQQQKPRCYRQVSYGGGFVAAAGAAGGAVAGAAAAAAAAPTASYAADLAPAGAAAAVAEELPGLSSSPGPAGSGSAGGARSRLEAMLLGFLSNASSPSSSQAAVAHVTAATATAAAAGAAGGSTAGATAAGTAAVAAAAAAAASGSSPSSLAASAPGACSAGGGPQAPATSGLRNFLSKGSSRFRHAAIAATATAASGEMGGGRSAGGSLVVDGDVISGAAAASAGAVPPVSLPPPLLSLMIRQANQRRQQQARQQQDVDEQQLAAARAADVWAFGLLLYTAAVGHLPFQGQHLVQTLVRVAGEGLKPGWPGGPHEHLRQLYGACTARQPGDRPSMTSVWSELKELERAVRQRSRRRQQARQQVQQQAGQRPVQQQLQQGRSVASAGRD